MFPFLIWAALHFGTRETVSLALLVSAIAVWHSVHGTGPFGTGSLDSRLILLASFMAVTGVSALLLAAVTAERRQAQEGLHRAHDELEVRIEQRTGELAHTVGQLQQVNQALTQRTAELARRNEEVEGFVYVASHDLRTPLVTLQGFAAELVRSCQQLAYHLEGSGLPAGIARAVLPIVEDEIPTALRHIGAGTAKFQRLIDALIALSRSGQQQYRSEEVDVQALVATAVDSLRPSIQTSEAQVTIHPLPAAMGDSTAIARVFSNLIRQCGEVPRAGPTGQDRDRRSDGERSRSLLGPRQRFRNSAGRRGAAVPALSALSSDARARPRHRSRHGQAHRGAVGRPGLGRQPGRARDGVPLDLARGGAGKGTTRWRPSVASRP